MRFISECAFWSLQPDMLMLLGKVSILKKISSARRGAFDVCLGRWISKEQKQSVCLSRIQFWFFKKAIYKEGRGAFWRSYKMAVTTSYYFNSVFHFICHMLHLWRLLDFVLIFKTFLFEFFTSFFYRFSTSILWKKKCEIILLFFLVNMFFCESCKTMKSVKLFRGEC